LEVLNVKSLTVVVLCFAMAFAFWAGFGFRSSLAQEGSGAGYGAGKYPPDIHPDTLSRMPRPKRDDFTTDEDKQSFDRVFAFEAPLRLPTGVLGPTGTRAWIPQLAEENRKFTNLIHEKFTGEYKYDELASLVAVRENDNPAEWFGHAKNATKFFGPKVVEVVQKEEDVSAVDDKKAAVEIQFARELFHQPIVSSKTFAEMEKSFGRRDTLNLTLRMGYYAYNAALYRAYDQYMDPGEKAPW
jgi:hypothetical protein